MRRPDRLVLLTPLLVLIAACGDRDLSSGVVLAKLEQEDRTAPKGFEDLPLFSATPRGHPEMNQPAEDPVAAALAAINPDDLSPREAMEALYVLKAKLADTRKS